MLALRNHIMGRPGTWRMLPASANGQPATACYVRDQHGTYQPYGVAVLTMTGAGISGVVSFGDPEPVAVFGFPPGLRA